MILGILGGMGPESTLDLFGKIIKLTKAEKDQDHLHIVIDNNSQIPDRTEGIMGLGQDPRIEMIRSAIKLEYMGADYIAIGCNTAHYYYEDIAKYTKVKVLHMIEELAIYLKKNHPYNKKYLLLATEGTYKSQIYINIFKKYDLCILEPEVQDRKTIMDWAYSVKSSEINTNKDEFEALVYKYTENYNVPVILGCTELPLLVEKLNINNGIYIDPTWVLAKHCVDLANNPGNK
ncbi:MAG: aspartate/glutamate racemase family protein [Tissierellia bacterium]|nr:aspartate/glutamate racemase family protein [Tissierellia bacterium]